MPKPAVARIWEGRTRAAIADEYAAYLYEHGVKKLRSTKGNLGVEVLRRTREDIAEFTTISYWSSRDEIRAYLLELPPPFVRHYDVLLSERD